MTPDEVFKKIDAFGQPLPSFNIKGKERVNTIVGGFCTLILFMTILSYGMLKFSNLITKPNPIINSYYAENEMDGVSINLNERNYKFAFTVESYNPPIIRKDDPRYVKYLVREYGKRNGKSYQRVLSYHNCTEQELDEFYPIKNIQTNLLKAIKEDPERGMYCIDWNDDEPFEI